MSSTCNSPAFSRDLAKQNSRSLQNICRQNIASYKKDVKLFFQEKLILTRMKIGSRVPGLISLVSLKQKISGGEKTPDTAVAHQEAVLSKRLEP